MKFTRILAAALILALVSSSAMASACATSCALGEAMAKVMHASSGAKNSIPAVSNDHCHLAVNDVGKQQHQPGAEHKSCTMGGCHFAQAATVNLDSRNFVTEFSSAVLPQFNTFALSADLSPPIKPPA